MNQLWCNQCWFFDDWLLHMWRLAVSNELCSLLILPAGLTLFLSLSLPNLALYYATSLWFTSFCFLVCCCLISIFYLCPCLSLYQACPCKFVMTSCLPVSPHVPSTSVADVLLSNMLTLSLLYDQFYFVIFTSKTAKAIPLDVVTCYSVENVKALVILKKTYL